MTKRLDRSVRQNQILDEALTQARKVGYMNIRREAIAQALDVSVGLISQQFTTMAQLKRDVMRAAVKRGIPEIVAQGLAMKDSHAAKASEELKSRARASLTV